MVQTIVICEGQKDTDTDRPIEGIVWQNALNFHLVCILFTKNRNLYQIDFVKRRFSRAIKLSVTNTNCTVNILDFFTIIISEKKFWQI